MEKEEAAGALWSAWLRQAGDFCAYRERSPQEVRAKLRRMGVPQASAEALLERLRAEGLLDEHRYACAYTHDHWRFQQWGRRKIAAGLYQKGIDESAVAQALEEEIEETAYRAQLAGLLERKWRALGSGPLDPRLRARLMRYAAQKGYEGELVAAELDQWPSAE